MAKTTTMIGIGPGELPWLRTLVMLLRHPDPSVPELARQALIYLSDAAANRNSAHPGPKSAQSAGIS